MERKKIRQESAFPTKPTQVVIGKESYTYQDENGRDHTGYRSMFGEVQNNGMSKRFYAACVAMQGMLAHPTIYPCRKEDEHLTWKEVMVKEAYEIADELLRQEEL